MHRVRKPGRMKLGKIGKNKVRKTMHEFKEGSLRSGSLSGPKVRNRKQAIAIALNQARREGSKIPQRGMKRR